MLLHVAFKCFYNGCWPNAV